MKLEFTDKALDRLTDIYDFISRGSSNRAAVEIHNTILDEIATLSVFPEMASIEPLLDEEPQVFWSLVVRRRYKVIYFIEYDTLKIVDIWDCRQNPKTLKRRMLKPGKK